LKDRSLIHEKHGVSYG